MSNPAPDSDPTPAPADTGQQTTEERTVTAVIPEGAPLLQQYDLPSADGVVGDLLVGVSTALLDRLGSPRAVKITVTLTAAPVPTEDEQTRTDVVVG